MSNDGKAGFALPVTVLVMAVLMAVTTAGLFVGRQELRIGTAGDDASRALYLAEHALAEVISDWDPASYGSLSVGDATTLVGTLEAGSWSLELTRLSSELYLLESTGKPTHKGTLASDATRRVGLMARVVTAAMSVPAALATREGISVRGTAEVHGEDVHPLAWGGICTSPLEDKPGILTNDASTVTTTGSGEITGAPAVSQDSTLSEEAFTMFGSVTWTELIAMADKSIPGGTFSTVGPALLGSGECDEGTSLNWGDPESLGSPCAGYFPVIHVTGDARMQGGGWGQGVLLVDGDLSLRGGFTFYGVIIVQGSFDTQGSGNRIYGGVLAGNADFENQSLTGGSVIQYSSCAVQRAVENSRGLTRARPLTRRSWIDLSAIAG